MNKLIAVIFVLFWIMVFVYGFAYFSQGGVWQVGGGLGWLSEKLIWVGLVLVGVSVALWVKRRKN